MSQYATLTDLANAVSANAISGIATPTQTAALQNASDLADGFLASQYKLPITLWGTDLTRAVCHIAAWDLLNQRGFNPEGTDSTFRTRYDDAMDWLTKIARGLLNPPGIKDSTPAARDGAPLVFSGQGGNTIGGNIVYPMGVTPYPYGPSGNGTRGW